MKVTNRFLAVLLSLALGAVAVIAMVESVLLQIDRPAWLIDRSAWDSFFKGLAYDDIAVLWIAIGTIVVGVLLLLTQLAPRRIGSYPIDTKHRHEIDRPTLVALVDQAALDAGALRSSTTLKRRRGTVLATLASNVDHAKFKADAEQRSAALLANVSKRKPRLKIRTEVEA